MSSTDTRLEVVAWTAEGAPRPNAVRLPADPFDGTVNKSAMYQAVKTFLANQRQGTAQTKTRGFVSGGNQKPWKQKGTGRARQGSTRAPNWPGGGKAFGPVPRDYRMGINRKLRRLARTSALNARAREQELHVVAPFALEAPKTRVIAALLARMGLTGERVLILTAAHAPNVARSARNIPDVEVLRFGEASAYDVLRASRVLVEESALGALESGAAVTVALPAPKARRADAQAGGRADAADAPAPKAKKKTVAKKAVAKKAAAKKAASKKAGTPARPHARTTDKKPAAKKPGKKKD